MIVRETIVYVVPKLAAPMPAPAEVPKPEGSFPFGTLILFALAVLIAFGVGKSEGQHVPSPANPPVAPSGFTPAGTTGTPINQ